MRVFCFLVLFSSFLISKAQLNINQTSTPTQLVQNVLLGSGVLVFNVTYTGSSEMIGAFTGNTNIGLSSGILMGTGKIVDPVFGGVNEHSSMPYDGYLFPQLSGDADLLTLSGSQPGAASIDACVLEFDFVPLGDTVKFRYVFGSEEYPDFVCSSFNDVFGFFISGPGISGPFSNNAINIALIPGTTMPVAINTVNDGNAGSGNNPADCQSLTNSAYYVNNSGATVVFNGLTTVLTAWAKVTACDTFHIKLAISDIGDGSYGSGVFLEKNSLYSNGTTTSLEYTQPTVGSFAVEGCSDAILHINLGAPAALPMTINYTIGGTATSGTDYTPIPTSITIPAGATADSIVIHPLTDGLTEDVESVIIVLQSISSCGAAYDSITININDNSPLSIDLSSDTTICANDVATLTAIVNGGLSPYSYNWSNGGSSSTIQASPTTTSTYLVTVSDYCGQTGTDTVVVTVSPELDISVPDVIVCPGQSATLIPSGASSYTWSTGITGSNPGITAPLMTTTTYTVTGTSSSCSGSASVTVHVDNFQGDFSISYPIPEDITTVHYTDLTSGSVAWLWDLGGGSSSTIQNPTTTYNTPGIYSITLIVTNMNDCIDTIVKSIEIYPKLEILIPNVFTPNGDGFNDVFGPVMSGFKSFHMEIYNRWGKMVFVTDDYEVLWDGIINNTLASDGVYFYVITVGLFGLDDYVANGTVTLFSVDKKTH